MGAIFYAMVHLLWGLLHWCGRFIEGGVIGIKIDMLGSYGWT